MSDRFWQAKIYTLVKSLNLKQVREIINNGQDEEQANIYLDALETVLSQSSNETIIKASELGRLINDASDRAIFNLIDTNSNSNQVVIKHLLSGAKLELNNLNYAEVNNLLDTSNRDNKTEARKNQDISLQELFWWLWRCLPQGISQQQGAESLLIPASDKLPDASIWSDASLSAALAGARVGYKDEDAVGEPVSPTSAVREENEFRPHLAIFSFSPIQELIKASRKMRDFWAGSWLLHYLSAKICWNIANKYGPDSLVYPSLYQQPLIDRWLLDKYPNFSNSNWIDSLSNRSLLTAGFPNVIVAVLPKSQVKAAMQTARQNLLDEWQKIGDKVFAQLKKWSWMPDLDKTDPTWNGWLKAQWQTYWTALPLGKEDLELEKAISELDDNWIEAQNRVCNLSIQTSANLKEPKPLFLEEEREFIGQFIDQVNEITQKEVSVNVGSWWPYTFDELRFALSSVKSARTWTIPTAFTMRSTVSGIGSVVTPKSYEFKRDKDNNYLPIREDTQQRDASLQKVRGLFDDKEQLNATETVKRGLHLVLPKLLNIDEKKIAASYPDLTSGIAGWLRTNQENHDVWQYYNRACKDIVESFPWVINNIRHLRFCLTLLEVNCLAGIIFLYKSLNRTKSTAYMPWGIPWIDEQQLQSQERYNPRLLNAGWAIEDFPYPETWKQIQQKELKRLKTKINSYFPPGNNPTDWYVLTVGDGDGMGEWLKGNKLEKYKRYLGDSLLNNPPEALKQSLNELKEVRKRMGPSTHNALSRALLDFSNRLVPYLTEERYAGRLIYSGGDDVFAYTNLWEWDKWLWDVRQCFCGAEDPHHEFRGGQQNGDYWQWQAEKLPKSLTERPLFTMGSKATISFGLVIAHHSVPLAIALESLWEAEEEAKEHFAVIHEWDSSIPIRFCLLLLNSNFLVGIIFLYESLKKNKLKDAVQVRVLFGNGNTLSATSKFDVFNYWQELLETIQKLKVSDCNSLPALLEQAAQTWQDHPAPLTQIRKQEDTEKDVIDAWVRAFCQRREILSEDNSQEVEQKLAQYLRSLIINAQEKENQKDKAEECDKQIQNWLKLAAFVLRNREIKLIS